MVRLATIEGRGPVDLAWVESRMAEVCQRIGEDLLAGKLSDWSDFFLTTEIDRRMIDRRMIDRRMVARNQRLRVLSAHESADILVDVIISFGVLYI
jgi:hypothetical protein